MTLIGVTSSRQKCDFFSQEEKLLTIEGKFKSGAVVVNLFLFENQIVSLNVVKSAYKQCNLKKDNHNQILKSNSKYKVKKQKTLSLVKWYQTLKFIMICPFTEM